MKNVWQIIGVMVLCASLTVGCISVEHPDGSKDTMLFGFIPLAHTDPEGNTTFFSAGIPIPGFDWLSLGLKVAAGVGTGLIFPRTRENLIGAAKAVGHGDAADAGKHVAALTPFFKTPVDPVVAEAKQKVGFIKEC